MNEHVWWYLSRASGIVAWAVATLSVLWGMALSTRALGNKPRAPWLLDLHRFLGGTTVLLVALHIGTLIPDSYTDFTVRDLVVPGASEWKPGALAWGIVAMYLLLAVELSSLMMRWLPRKAWRAIHLASYAVYVLATIHFLAAGTDAKLSVVRVIAIASGAVILFFLVYQIIGPGRAASVRSSGSAGSTKARAQARAGTPGVSATREVTREPSPHSAPHARRAGAGHEGGANDRTAALRAARAALADRE